MKAFTERLRDVVRYLTGEIPPWLRTWPVCINNGCRGRSIVENGHCLEHATNEEFSQFVESLKAGATIDVRGTLMSQDHIKLILRNVPKSTDGRIKLQSVWFTDCRFESRTVLDEIEFNGDAIFIGAEFTKEADFINTRFNARAMFLALSSRAVPGSRGSPSPEKRFLMWLPSLEVFSSIKPRSRSVAPSGRYRSRRMPHLEELGSWRVPI
jgi:hypothetical protein